MSVKGTSKGGGRGNNPQSRANLKNNTKEKGINNLNENQKRLINRFIEKPFLKPFTNEQKEKFKTLSEATVRNLREEQKNILERELVDIANKYANLEFENKMSEKDKKDLSDLQIGLDALKKETGFPTDHRVFLKKEITERVKYLKNTDVLFSATSSFEKSNSGLKTNIWNKGNNLRVYVNGSNKKQYGYIDVNNKKVIIEDESKKGDIENLAKEIFSKYNY